MDISGLKKAMDNSLKVVIYVFGSSQEHGIGDISQNLLIFEKNPV